MSIDTGPAKLPALPFVPTGKPALDNLLRAIIERLEVREGSRGNPAERVVTHRELKNLNTPMAGVTVAQAQSGADGVVVKLPGGGYAPMSIDRFAEEIRKTALYQHLLSRLDDPARFDDLPEKIRAILSEDLALEAAQRQADVQRVDHKFQSTTESLAYALQEVTASVEKSAAGIRELSFASATPDSAVAGRVTTLEARLDDVGGATMEESLLVTADRVDGLAGEYMLKINAGNAIAGFGLSASEDLLGNTQSAFIVQADKFALSAPANFAQETVPSASAIGQMWFKPSTKAYYRSTAVGTDGWLNFAPAIPFGVDMVNNTIFMNGDVLINAGGPSFSSLAKYTINLSNEAFTVATNADGTGGVFDQSARTSVNIYEGSVADTINWSFSILSSEGCTAEISGNGTASVMIQVLGMTADNCLVTVAATKPDAPMQTAVFTGAKAKAGQDGTPATVYRVRSSVGILHRTATGYSPQEVTFSAFQITGAGAPTFYSGRFVIATSTNGVDFFTQYTSDVNESLKTYTPPEGISHLRVSLFLKDGTSTLVDVETLVVVTDGARGKTGESTVRVTASSSQWKVNTNGDPVVTSITLTALILEPLTGFVTWSRAGGGGIVPAPGTTNTWVVYAADQTNDSENYTASFASEGVTYTGSTTLVRVRDGERGSNGSDGSDGAAGSTGSIIGYGSKYGVSSGTWSDTMANRVIQNLLTGDTQTVALSTTDHLLIGDTVTLSNGTDFAETRYWGGTSWLTPGVVLDGNLLVNGTVSATKVSAGSISAGGATTNASIDIGENAFTGSYTSPFRLRKTAARAGQILLTSVNTKDNAVSIWGANASGLTGANGVTGTWHLTEADYNATRWTLFGALGSDLYGAGVAGLVFGSDQTRFGGVFAAYGPASDTVGATPPVVQVQLATAYNGGIAKAAIFTGPVQLKGADSSLLLGTTDGAVGQMLVSMGGLNTPAWLAQGTSGQVLTSGGAGVLPTWTTVSSGGGSITYGDLQAVTSGTTGSSLNLSTTFRATGLNTPTSGAGVELAYASNVGWLVCYDRTNLAYRSLNIDASGVAFNVTPTCPTPATATNSTAVATTAYVKAQGYTANTGTVTSFSFTTGNGITGTVSTASTTPALALTLGAVTGTSFNGVTGLSSTTPSAPGTAATGNATTAARANHVHPLQTSVTGSAGNVGGYKCAGGTGTSSASANTTINFGVTFSSAATLGLSVTSTWDTVAVIISVSTSSAEVAVQSNTTGARVATSFRWTAVGT